MSKKTDKEQMQVLGAFMHEIVAMHSRFIDYMQKWELWDFLEPEEQEFLNEQALLIRKLLDTKGKKKNG